MPLAAQPPNDGAAPPGRVLVIDDSESAGRELGETLRAQGLSVTVVRSGAEALAQVPELKAAAEALERQVLERTAELHAAHQRLEATLAAQTALEKRMSHEALHDTLTGLANRVLFRDRLLHALSHVRRSGEPLAVMFLDLDGVKPINDSLGHAAGDEVLAGVARRLREALRDDDTCARLGGDEFALLMEGTDLDEARAVAARISESLALPHRIGRVEVFAGACIGIAQSLTGEESADELLRNADLAMFTAKSRGNGSHEVFEATMHAAMIERMSLEVELRRAVDRHEFFLQYQPIVAISDGRIVGTEALVRWRHPERGIIPPAVFIPLAEETGLIVPLGRWVLREACQKARRWRNLPSAGFKMSVNVSPRQLQQEGLVEEVERALRDFEIDPRSLILEITESIALQEREPVLVALKALGVKLAIDDFGTGYSSLGYLRRLQVDIVKIHKSFIDGIAAGGDDAELGRAIVRFGRAMGLRTTAEGIESPEQWTELQALSCDFGQGYHFSRPIDSADFEALLGRQAAELPAVG